VSPPSRFALEDGLRGPKEENECGRDPLAGNGPLNLDRASWSFCAGRSPAMAMNEGKSRSALGSSRGSSWLAVAVAVLVAAIAVAVGVLWATGFFAPHPAAKAPAYCPLDVSSEITAPSPGTSNNSSSPGSYAPGSVVFSASASGCVPPYTFAYTFGDGTSSQMANVTHVYPAAGYYSGSLVVTASTGAGSSSFFCVNATAWPNISIGSGSSALACP
jgi:hypothetical protein